VEIYFLQLIILYALLYLNLYFFVSFKEISNPLFFDESYHIYMNFDV